MTKIEIEDRHRNEIIFANLSKITTATIITAKNPFSL